MTNIQRTMKYSLVLGAFLFTLVAPVLSSAQVFVPLQVTCFPNMSSAPLNASVGWYVNLTGGNGIYNYFWSGSDNLSGNTNPLFRSYSATGTKTASVMVISGGQSITANCGSITIYDQLPSQGSLGGSCSANVSSALVGSTINWSGYAFGGNGSYTYSWNDSDGYSSFGQYVSRYYTTAGNKSMTLTITSSGQTITRNCSVYVIANPNIVSSGYPTFPTYPNYPIQNQVLGYNDPNPSLSAVYLSDIPSTGIEDTAKGILFIISLLLWSAYIAYLFIRQKTEGQLAFVALQDESKQVSIDSDIVILESITNYAREKKVLLSRDAAIKIAKMQKLKNRDPKDMVNKLSQGDWVAIGEGDIRG